MRLSGSPARRSLRAVLLAALVLCAGSALGGCTVAGAVVGGAIGAVIGGPDGAAALGEAGLLIGAGIDAAIVGAVIEGDHHQDQAYHAHHAQHAHHDHPANDVETVPHHTDESAAAHRYEY